MVARLKANALGERLATYCVGCQEQLNSTVHVTTCRGFGFIKFADPQSVDKVLSSPTHVIDEKKVE